MTPPQISHWGLLDAAQQVAVLARPALARGQDMAAEVAAIVAGVRERGDAALRDYAARFDDWRGGDFAVQPPEFAAARQRLDPREDAALRRALANIEAFHRAQLPRPLRIEVQPGVICERLYRPIGAVGLYVPAGSAPLPSTVLMLAVPAQLAGCPRRVLCTPPGPDGRPHAAVLRAAELCDIDTVLCLGGAHAIAALAYGTQSIARVDKIFGPGNAWVTAAKQMVAADPEGVAIDLPAGPSEVMVVADAEARATFLAADLLAQAEHDALAQALLVTTSPSLAAATAAELQRQAAALGRRAILARSLASCRILVVPDLAVAAQIVNRYAPEHLILQVRDPRRLLADIDSAGSVFLGEWSPEPLGDYCTGTNHVLPTYGQARACSGLGVESFMRSMTVQELSPEGLALLGPVALRLAGLEGLDAHGAAVRQRLECLAGNA